MSKDLRQGISGALLQIRIRALRDAPVYLQHVSLAEQELNQLVSGLYTKQQVEQMMNELVGVPVVSKSRPEVDPTAEFARNDLQIEQRQSIPLIIKKYGASK